MLACFQTRPSKNLKIFSSIIFSQVFKLFIPAFFGTVQYSHREHLKGLYIDQYIWCAS